MIPAGLIVVVLCWGVIGGFVGTLLGHFKNRKAAGLFLGYLFGPFGWIAVLFMPNNEAEEEGCVSGIFAMMCVVALTAVIGAGISGAINREQEKDRIQENRDARLNREQQEEQARMQAEEHARMMASETARANPTPYPKATPAPPPRPRDVNAEILRKYGNSNPLNRPAYNGR